MNTLSFTESVVESAALARMESLGYAIKKHRAEIARSRCACQKG